MGSYSTRGGAKAGMLFSLGFTVQRAALSEVAYFALASVFMSNMVDGITYMVVGGVMAASGLYIRNRLRYPHFHAVERYLESLAHIHGGEKSRREMQHTENPVGGRRASGGECR
ncbi:hypothetical protein [Thermogymnomonas acidicola]|uniref:hypothetical protein n=1 Tax=Thermogymnomonas acidicola TaxID=399579 RepID=UPI0009461F9F|nr:hypothetical protein [Thermogymnomonas acidicola]